MLWRQNGNYWTVPCWLLCNSLVVPQAEGESNVYFLVTQRDQQLFRMHIHEFQRNVWSELLPPSQALCKSRLHHAVIHPDAQGLLIASINGPYRAPDSLQSNEQTASMGEQFVPSWC